MSTWEEHLSSRYTYFLQLVNRTLKSTLIATHPNLEILDAIRRNLPQTIEPDTSQDSEDTTKYLSTTGKRNRVTVKGYKKVYMACCQWIVNASDALAAVMDAEVRDGVICIIALGMVEAKLSLESNAKAKNIVMVPPQYQMEFLLNIAVHYAFGSQKRKMNPKATNDHVIELIQETIKLTKEIIKQSASKHPLLKYAFISASGEILNLKWNVECPFVITTEIAYMELKDDEDGNHKSTSHRITSIGMPTKVIFEKRSDCIRVQAVVTTFKTHKDTFLRLGYCKNDEGVLCGPPIITTFANDILLRRKNRVTLVNSMDNNKNVNGNVSHNLSALHLNSNRGVLEDEDEDDTFIAETDEEDMED